MHIIFAKTRAQRRIQNHASLIELTLEWGRSICNSAYCLLDKFLKIHFPLYKSINSRRGSSSASFTRTRNVTAPLPSTTRWS